MQPAYRRTTYQRRKKDKQGIMYGYRKSIIQQTAVCVLIFITVLSVKISANTALDSVKNTISYTIVNNTDWQEAVRKIKNLIKDAVSADKSLNEHEILTKIKRPAEGEVISEFGMRFNEKTQKDEFHYGVDFNGNTGDKIFAAADGEVSEVGFSDEFGNFILIRHDDKISSYYAHCDKILPVKGDKIKSGQVIATIGNSGNISTPCLHFEIREGDTSLDPMVFLEDKQ